MARLLSDGDERYETGERHAGVALLTLLRSLAQEAPVLLAVDDVEWLDGPSARTISFALRRLEREPVGLLVTHEKRSDIVDPLDLDHALGSSARHLRLGPLTGEALRLIVRAQVGPDVPHTMLLELERLSSGNPGIALEIARGAIADDAPTWPVPVPPRLREAARDEVAALAPEVLEVLLVVAALDGVSTSVLEEVLGADPAVALTEAEGAGIVALQADRVAFVQPLAASAIYLDAPADERRRVHRRIAEVVGDTEERSFHLALATPAPDAVVAGAVDAAAASARARGARGRAAELLELACSLTPVEHRDELLRRRLDAADEHAAAGNAPRARHLLESALADVRAGATRAQVLARLGRVRLETDSVDAAVDLGEQALAEGSRGALDAEVAADLATAELLRLELQRCDEHAAVALDRAEELGDDGLVAESIATLAVCDELVGGEVWAPIVEVGLRLERVAGVVRPERGATLARARLMTWLGDLDGARRVLEGLQRSTVAADRQRSRAFVLADLARVELLAGSWDRAGRLLDDAERESVIAGHDVQRALVLGAQAHLGALRGDETAARALAADGLDLAQRTGCRVAEVDVGAALGLLELSLGHVDRAADELAAVTKTLDAAGVVEPGALRHVPDLVEAALAAGSSELAAAVLESFEARSRVLRRPWVTALAARCRGLVLAATGDLEQSLEVLDGAIEVHRGVPMPFDRARTLLASGRTRRRAKQWGPAREALEGALACFEALGAARWSAAARDDLERIGGRTPASASELTPAEQQAAELVAHGMTNRQVADALFVSLKTVEATLTRVYRKLGVKSRAELRATYGAAAEPPNSEAGDAEAGDSEAGHPR
jgi:DNA-binding CsgD family transcriptional regulator